MADEDVPQPALVADQPPVEAPEQFLEVTEDPVIDSFTKVAYTPPSGTETPVYVEGLAWHDRTQHTVPPNVAERLRAQPGFTVVGPADAPKTPNP